MKKVVDRAISQGQLFFLIIQTQLGVGILSLPFAVHNSAKGDGWMATLFAGIVIQLWIFISINLVKLFPGKNLYQIIKALFGKVLGNMFVLIYTVYFTTVAALVAVLQTSLINNWMLPLTPFWVIYFLIIIVSVYLASDNILMIARYFSLLTPIILFFIILTISVYKDVQLSYILPVKQSNWKDIFLATKDVMIALTGFEIILIVYHTVLNKTKTLRTLTYANISTVSIYTFFVFTSLIYFSPDELPLVPEPVLYMLKAISFEVIERLDLVFLAVWIIPMTNSFIIYLFQASIGLKELFKKDTHAYFPIFLVIPIFVSGFFFQDKFLMEQVGKYFQYLILSFAFVLPLLFFMVAVIKKKWRKEKKHAAST
ncbi:GerAB/ArcD/ProY family transporter [Sutcliffiella rhizosphaerae]|uniref:Spore germination protein YndE n=1 Tax=Sutcliffiella rhizosphaerae TaxID=2880967 RepID=A0ABM8YKP2_9BACI|nr:endospore germination permease [Sutcliffiella rhizosphaerae]CAG9620519.1 Spore germination protein YndE [Sutcliffiella rhizosphaerae]